MCRTNDACLDSTRLATCDARLAICARPTDLPTYLLIDRQLKNAEGVEINPSDFNGGKVSLRALMNAVFIVVTVVIVVTSRVAKFKLFIVDVGQLVIVFLCFRQQ